MLTAIAAWLESPDNEAILLAEYDDDCLQRVAEACISAATTLKKCADEVDLMEPNHRLLINEAKQLLQTFSATPFAEHTVSVKLFDEDDIVSDVTASPEEALVKLNSVELPEDVTASISIIGIDGMKSESLNTVARLASVFDASEDASLKKQASVIDEILLTIAAPPDWVKNFKSAQEKKIDELKRLYEEPNKFLHKNIGVSEAEEAIKKSPFNKEYRIMEHALSARSCPEHHGAQMQRISDHMWRCCMDGKIYNYLTGYTTERNEKVPGGDVAEQTKTMSQLESHQIFNTRESELLGRSLK